ncbi:unnamed protein product [Aphanomyces euteiches]
MNDRQGWIWSSKSIELPCCPPFDATVGLLRLTNYGSGFVFLEADRPGQLDMFYVAHWECGQLFKQFDDMLMQQCRMLLNVDRFLREIRLSLLPSVPPVVSTPSTRQCQLCTKKFLPFSKRSHCKKCGQVCWSSWCSSFANVLWRFAATAAFNCGDFPNKLHLRSLQRALTVRSIDLHLSPHAAHSFTRQRYRPPRQ